MAMFGNTFGVDPETQQAISRYAAMPATSAQPAQDHKFFGKGGTGRAIAGYIGDYLAQIGGAQPLYAPAVQHQRDLADAQREQQAKLAQWVWQQQYSANNPEPTEQQKNYQYYSHLSPQEQAVYNQSRQGDPYVNTVLPNGFIYTGPASQMGSALRGDNPPSAPVGRLTPIEPTTQNTPAPQIGSNGFPASLTLQQYQATVNALGKDKTDAWMQRYGIRIGN